MTTNGTASRALEIEDPLDGDEEFGDAVRYAIASYGADMPVDAMVQRLDRDDIFVPQFQRKFVWSRRQASRFVESLLLGLPVPGVFLFRVPKSRKLMVVDGQQRILTLQRFRHGRFNDKPFALTGVSDDFDGLTYRDLQDKDKREFNDSIIHATIFEQLKPSDDRSSVYSVFERLNTGGTPLQPQEIRACVYRGVLNDLLKELSQYPPWKKLYRSKNTRKKDEEIILRVLALYESLADYERPMKQFLNDFMERKADIDECTCDALRKRFEGVARAVATHLGYQALRPERSLNVSVVDAVMVGLAHRLDRGPIRDPEALREAHKSVLERLKEAELYKTGTTDKERVTQRVQIARETYGAVE